MWASIDVYTEGCIVYLHKGTFHSTVTRPGKLFLGSLETHRPTAGAEHQKNSPGRPR